MSNSFDPETIVQGFFRNNQEFWDREKERSVQLNKWLDANKKNPELVQTQFVKFLFLVLTPGIQTGNSFLKKLGEIGLDDAMSMLTLLERYKLFEIMGIFITLVQDNFWPGLNTRLMMTSKLFGLVHHKKVFDIVCGMATDVFSKGYSLQLEVIAALDFLILSQTEDPSTSAIENPEKLLFLPKTTMQREGIPSSMIRKMLTGVYYLGKHTLKAIALSLVASDNLKAFYNLLGKMKLVDDAGTILITLPSPEETNPDTFLLEFYMEAKFLNAIGRPLVNTDLCKIIAMVAKQISREDPALGDAVSRVLGSISEQADAFRKERSENPPRVPSKRNRSPLPNGHHPHPKNVIVIDDDDDDDPMEVARKADDSLRTKRARTGAVDSGLPVLDLSDPEQVYRLWGHTPPKKPAGHEQSKEIIRRHLSDRNLRTCMTALQNLRTEVNPNYVSRSLALFTVTGAGHPKKRFRLVSSKELLWIENNKDFVPVSNYLGDIHHLGGDEVLHMDSFTKNLDLEPQEIEELGDQFRYISMERHSRGVLNSASSQSRTN